MRKQKCAIFLLAGMLASASYATWQQDVILCLNVNSTAPVLFEAGVTNTDIFESWSFTQQGKCVKKSYNHGPKNFKLTIVPGLRYAAFAKLYPDSSCSYLNKVSDAQYDSKVLGTGRHHEYWTFNLTQRDGKEGDKFTYDLSCQHWATD